MPPNTVIERQRKKATKDFIDEMQFSMCSISNVGRGGNDFWIQSCMTL